MDRWCPEGTHSSAIAMSRTAFPLILTLLIYRIEYTPNPPLFVAPHRPFSLKCLVLQCFSRNRPWKMAKLGPDGKQLQAQRGKWQLSPGPPKSKRFVRSTAACLTLAWSLSLRMHRACLVLSFGRQAPPAHRGCVKASLRPTLTAHALYSSHDAPLALTLLLPLF